MNNGNDNQAGSTGECATYSWCGERGTDHDATHASNVVEVGGSGWWAWLYEHADNAGSVRARIEHSSGPSLDVALEAFRTLVEAAATPEVRDALIQLARQHDPAGAS